MAAQVEKHEFQAEVNQVLSIVVKSLYSHKEVFLVDDPDVQNSRPIQAIARHAV